MFLSVRMLKHLEIKLVLEAKYSNCCLYNFYVVNIIIYTRVKHIVHHMSRIMRKPVYAIYVRAIWSAPLLFAAWIV